jgi:ferredoxin, 2Fe-2S
MAIIVATDRTGKVHRIEAQTGISVMLNLKDNGGLDVAAICGGCCSCATCHVYVAAEWLGRLDPPDVSERELVEDSFYPRPESRLSCQIEFTEQLDGLAVTLAPED